MSSLDNMLDREQFQYTIGWSHKDDWMWCAWMDCGGMTAQKSGTRVQCVLQSCTVCVGEQMNGIGIFSFRCLACQYLSSKEGTFFSQ